MKRHDDGLGFMLVVGFALGCLCVKACEAVAQDGGGLSMRDREDVARCLTAEAPPGPDYPAILSVLSQRASSLGSAARRYCALFVAHRLSPRQQVIRALPGGPGARRYAGHFQAALAAVDAWERGERPPCTPDHFGDRLHDAERARRAGWSAVDCGRTANLFWRGRP